MESKYEADSNNWHKEYLKLQLEHNKLKRILEEKIQPINMFKRSSDLSTSKRLMNSESLRGKVLAVRSNMSEDPDQTITFKTTRKKIFEKSKLINTRYKKTTGSHKDLKAVNTTIYSCSSTTLDKENVEQNVRKPKSKSSINNSYRIFSLNS